jgi:hypothetical protein
VPKPRRAVGAAPAAANDYNPFAAPSSSSSSSSPVVQATIPATQYQKLPSEAGTLASLSVFIYCRLILIGGLPCFICRSNGCS